MKDFTRLTETERRKIEAAHLNLLCAAAALQGVLYDAHNPGVRGLIREHCDMNENFLPAPRLGIIGIFERLDDARCPVCDGKATGEDCCECPDTEEAGNPECYPTDAELAAMRADAAAAYDAKFPPCPNDADHEPTLAERLADDMRYESRSV